MHSYFALAVIVACAACTLTGIAIGGAVADYLHMCKQAEEWKQRVTEVERLIAQLQQPQNKHDVEHRLLHDVGEATVTDLIRVADDFQITYNCLKYALERAEHVMHGHTPDTWPPKEAGK